METVTSIERRSDERQFRKLQTRDLCARYGVSDRSIDRWLTNPALEFPRPLVINGRRFWNATDIDAWDARQRVLSCERADHA